MGSRQLAIVLAPNILRSPGGSDDPVTLMSRIASANTVVTHVMDYYFTKSSNIRNSVGKWRPVSQLFAQKSQKSQLLFEIQNFKADGSAINPSQQSTPHRNPLHKLTSEKRFTTQRFPRSPRNPLNDFKAEPIGVSEHRGYSPEMRSQRDIHNTNKVYETFSAMPKTNASSLGALAKSPNKHDAPILGIVRGQKFNEENVSPPKFEISLSLDSASPISAAVTNLDCFDIGESSNDRWNNINEINEKNANKRTQKITGISTYRTQSTLWKKCSPTTDNP